MMRCLRVCLMIILCTLSPVLAWADGPQFNGNCSTISWDQVTTSDLAGYKIYDRTSPSGSAIIHTVGPNVTSLSCSFFGFNAGQHYLAISSVDVSGNESAESTQVAFVIVLNNTVNDLSITVVNATDMTLSFTEVDGGNGQPATYDMRFATPTINWGTAASVTSGGCSTPLAGTTIGATKTCTVTGLSVTTAYQFQLVPYRGTLGVDAVYGPLSNITGATTGGSPPSTDERILASDNFLRADATTPGSNWTTVTGYDPLALVSNVLQATRLGIEAFSIYSALAFPANQWAQHTLSSYTGASQIEDVVVLRSNGSDTEYLCRARRNGGANSSTISKHVAGNFTNLDVDNTVTWAASDVHKCKAVGSTITQLRNGTPVFSVDDGSIASGQPGILLYTEGTITNNTVTAWSAGNFTTATAETCDCDQH